MSLLLPSSTTAAHRISHISSTAPPFNNSSSFSSFTNSSTATILTGSGPSKTSAAAVVEHNPYALVLALIPILTIFGNSMVILAVRREKSLQTVTNYLIVSLASADLLVATCVMFFAVYFEWNSFVWDLGPTLCNLYIGADVACSTASILNLLAISIDRYIAISHPLAYCQIGTKNSRAYLSIALVWCVSIAVAVPVAFGANHIEQEHECSFTNPVFMIGSSLLSFFVPCLAMIALYAVIFRRLREREKARDMRKRGPTLGVDNALILNALMGGARMARQIAKSHLKDQLLLELSKQTSSFPTPSDEEEEEEEEDEPEEHSDSEGSTQQRHKISSQHQMSSSNHKMSSSEANRRPTFCLMLNGGTGLPFPLAPMNPLTLPKSGLLPGEEEGEAGKRPRRPSRHRKLRGAALVLRRCNTLPTAILRRPMTMNELDATKDVTEVNNNEPTMPFLGENDGRIMANGIGGEMYFMEGMLGRETPRPCSESASQFSLRDCPSSSFWHDDELSTQRSFGEGLQEDLPFIDSQSQSSSNSSESSEGSGSTSSMDRRKWSESAMTDPTAAKARRRLTLERPPIRAHSSYCGWPEDVEEEVKEAEVMEEEDEEEKEGETDEKTRPMIPLTLIQLASPQHFTSSDANSSIKCQYGHQPVKRLFSSAVGPKLDLLDSLIGRHKSSAAYQSMPNLLNNQFTRLDLDSPLPIEKNEREEGDGMAEWLQTMMEWAKRNEEQKLAMGDHRIEVGFTVDEEKSNMTTTSIWRPSGERRSASIGNRSVRIAAGHGKDKGFGRHSEKLALSSVCPIPSQMPPPSSTNPLQRNGSCLMSAKSSSHQSPLQRIRNAFRRSLLAAMDEKRRPSRQLLKRATKQMRREQKATVTLAVVLAVFLCCWVPFFALHLSNALCLLSGGQQCVHLLAMFLSTWLGYLNSSLNPLIYTVFDKRFRKAFRELLAFCLGPPGIGGGGLNRTGGGRARQR